MLNHEEILERIKNAKLIEDYLDLDSQLQPSSFDMTLAKIYAFETGGSIDFDNKERKLSQVRELQFDKDGWVELPQGVYKIQFAETVNMPSDLGAITICRSSLARCGCDVYNGFWDPGYHGKGEATFIVHNPNGVRLKRRAKIVQIIFLPVSEARQLYSGIHKGENLK
ncbi:MAG: deoxyuridine 5'-triphosphate nucleotidohydrolase [Candidatus Micrarchaeia archaeon]